jgi:hypothetical protein
VVPTGVDLATPHFKYASFVSYRHGQSALKQAFIEQFAAGVSAELEALRNEKLFVDKERLKGGDFFNAELPRAIYESATMIVVYQPNYFDTSNPYCTREYRGMCELEGQRLTSLANAQERNHGLIVPVIYRGERELPADMRDQRQYHDFSAFTLVGRGLSRNREYAPKLREIAEYIHERCKTLEANDVPFADADNYRLPSNEEVCKWIRSLNLPGPKFPISGGGR